MNVSPLASDKVIFMDYQSTTKVDPRVLEAMIPWFGTFCNSHSRSHKFGWVAESAVDEARASIAAVIGADPKEIIFTSGATESTNLAIKGVAEFYKEKGRHIITVVTEHKCVIDTCRYLRSSCGFDVTFIPVQNNGIIDLSELESAFRDDTILVSVMAANNEIGVLQPLAEIGKMCHERCVFFHTDAAQAFGKVPLNVRDMCIDLLSISGHKIYAPMGIGALYVRRKNPRVRLSPMMHGGAQERGLRSGTVPSPLAIGLGVAADIALKEMDTEAMYLLELRNYLYDKVVEVFPQVVLNGDKDLRLPGNLNLSFPYIEGESLLMVLNKLALSSGSACTSASLEPSHVVRALNVREDLEHSSIRFGFGRFTTRSEIEEAAALISENVMKLLDMSPLWEMVQNGVDLSTVKWDSHH